MRAVRAGAMVTVGLSLLVVASGCSAKAPIDEAGAEHARATETARVACDGVYVVTDLGPEFSPILGSCVSTETTIVAIDAFARAGIPVSEGEAFPGSVCRVSGYPDASSVLRYEQQRFVEKCQEISPAWAYWGLFIDSGAGWTYAEEGANTQQIQPGEAVAFAWQYGNPTMTRVPKLPE